MTPKKFTRGLFYVLAGTGIALALYYIVPGIIRNWSKVSDLFLAIALCGVFYGFFRLFMWAFLTDDDTYKPKKQPRNWQTPDYYQASAMHLSDGRSCTPRYYNKEFIGNFPHDPYVGEKIGDYTWGKNDNGLWMWIREGEKTHV